jgi:hypothetical protein
MSLFKFQFTGGFLAIFLLSCGSNENSNVNRENDDSLAKAEIAQILRNDSLAEARKDSIHTAGIGEYRTLHEEELYSVQNDLFNSIHDFDRENGLNTLSKLKNILSYFKVSCFDLYIELTEIRRKSKKEAIVKATANGQMERNYVHYIARIEDGYIAEFLIKYGMNNQVYICFKNNYCSCYGDNFVKYCNGRKCDLINSEYWK